MAARAFQIGSSWFYAEDLESLTIELDGIAQVVRDVLAEGGIHRFSYLSSRLAKIYEFQRKDVHFKRAILNYGCSRALLRKLLCLSKEGEWYASYFHPNMQDVVTEAVNTAYERLRQRQIITFRDLSRALFGGVKGSYYWTQGICEHLVWLRLASHVDNYRITLQ